MNTFETPFECPSCKKQLDASTAVQGNNGEAPIAGDLSVCFSCGAFLKFTGPSSTVCLSDAEFNKLDFETKRVLDCGKQVVLSRNVGAP
jgi:hypothetical protein